VIGYLCGSTAFSHYEAMSKDIYDVEMVMVIRSLFAITAFVAFGVLMWLAWKIAVFLFMLWIVVGIASSAMKGH
jgi:fatty acid desaturase